MFMLFLNDCGNLWTQFWNVCTNNNKKNELNIYVPIQLFPGEPPKCINCYPQKIFAHQIGILIQEQMYSKFYKSMVECINGKDCEL